MADKPWLKHYDSPTPASLAPYPEIPFFHLLDESARRYPKRAITWFKGRSVSYARMQAETDNLAVALHNLGVRKGDRIGLLMPNTPDFILAFFGILKAGGIVVAANPLFTPPELAYEWKDAGVERVLLTSNFYAKAKKAQPQTPVKQFIVSRLRDQLPSALALGFALLREKREGHRVRLEAGDLWLCDLLKQDRSAQPWQSVQPFDLALIQYSGGTTGLPKGAMATHQALVVNTLQLRAWLHQARDGLESCLMALPMFHSYGMLTGMAISIIAAATLILVPDPRDINDLMRTAHRTHPTGFPGVPTLYSAILNHPEMRAKRNPFQSLRFCVSGAAPLPKSVQEQFEALTGGKLIEGYGLSEATTVTHANPFLGENRSGSIGLPLPDVECQIVSLEDGVTSLPPGEAGELILRSPQVFVGYWNQPQETSVALHPCPDGRGPWLHTGDVARMDADGFFYLIDRKKELIKASGFQVLPREVEDVLLEHPLIQDVCVAGVPDAYRGETVKAWIVLKSGAPGLSLEEVREFCEEHLARYKIPTQIELRSNLPKNLIGKVLRRELIAGELSRSPE